MLALTGLMTASLAASIGLTTVSASALDVGTADENGWVQNANTDAITLNEEGASVITTTAGGVTTYNTTALDVTKDNYITFRSTGTGFLGVYLVDDYTNVLNGGNLYLPNATEQTGRGQAADHVKVSAIMQSSGFQLGYGYSLSGEMILGTINGNSAVNVSEYTTIKYHIGTGAEGDTSCMEINGTQVVGEAGKGESLTVTQEDFADGKAYIVFQTLEKRSIYAMGTNEDPVMLESAEFIPMGMGSAQNAGFMLNKTMENIPAEGYQITADKAVNNVLVNGKTLAEAGAMLYVLEGEVDGLGKIQSLGLLPAAGNETGFSWKVGDTITFLEGFTIYDSTGKALWDLKRDFGFYVNSVAEDGSCTFAAQIGLSWNGTDGDFVNLNLTYAVNAAAAVAQENVTAITLNGAPLSENGYFNLATPTIIQLLKNEGDWTWTEGDTIYIPYGFTFKDSSNYTYAIDANYTLTYGASGFTLTKTEAGAARPVSVQGMQLGHYDAVNNLYGMQIVFAENVRGDIEANTDIVGEAWFNTFVKVNGKTLAEIRQIQVGTDAENQPIYATVRANFEGEDFITLWIDGRAGVVEPGDNKLGAGAVVTILPGIEFPSGFITKEEQSFEWTGDTWKVTVAVDQFELSLEDGQQIEAGVQGDPAKAFVNIAAQLSELTSIDSFPIQDSAELKEYVMINGQLLSQMAGGVRVLQFNGANTLQIELNQSSWTVGDRFVLLKGMPLYNDIPSSPNAQKVAELAHYYIFDCTSTDGKVMLTVTVTDVYEADEDIDLDYAGMKQFNYDAQRDAYGFQLTFTKNVRGDAYDKFVDLTGEDWIKNFITINGKSIEGLLAATDKDGNPITKAVEIVFGDDKYLSIYVSAKIPADQGGVVDAEGNVIETVRVAVADGFTLPRGGSIAMGIAYKYEYGGWCKDIDLSQVEYQPLAVTTINNPVSVDADGNIAFKIYFDKEITTAQYNHINAGAEWLSGVDLGYTQATIDYLASYGFIRDCLTKIEYNGMTIEELMDTETDPAFRPINVVMVHYDKNEIQIVFRTNSVNTNDETYGQPTPYAINISDPNPNWTITIKEGFTVPTLCKTDRDYTFSYNKDEGRFVEVFEEEVISEIVFEAVAYDGTVIEEGGTLNLTGVTELDKNLFTIAFKDGVSPEWTIEGNSLQVGANTVSLVAQTTDGSGKTVSFTFTVNVTAAQTPETPATNNTGLIVGLSVGGAVIVLAAVAVAVILISKKKKAGK